MNPAHHETDPRQLLQQMLLIRAYEEAIVAGSTAGTVPGTCTSVGQEAAAVGVVNALGADDLILTNHRSAGHLLTRGAHAVLCLNAPHLQTGFLQEQMQVQAPDLHFEQRLTNPPAFADSAPERALKVLVYRAPG